MRKNDPKKEKKTQTTMEEMQMKIAHELMAAEEKKGSKRGRVENKPIE